MPLARRRRRSRSVVVALAVVAVVVGLAPAADAADPPTAGDVVVGELVRAWPEHRDPDEAAERGDDGPLSWISTEAGDTVRVPTEDVDHLPVGATVEVTVGEQVHDEASREDGLAPAREVVDSEVVAPAEATPPGTAPASAPYTDDVTAVLVSPPGTAHDGTTVSQLVTTLNGPVADFWESQSGGLVKIHGTAGPSSWIDTAHGCDDPVAMWNEVASNPLVNFARTSGKHLMLYVPGYFAGDAPDCAYGLAQVGPTTRTYGGFLYVRADDVAVMAHELGHNFGLGHSSEVQCDRAVDTGTCRTWSYADFYDVMGYSWGEVGSLNVVQAARIGLLPAGQRQSVTTSTPAATYTLAPVSGRTGTRALTLTAADGTVYWLEYRPAAEQDAWLGTAANRPGLQAGVLLRRAGSSGDTSLLLDATPSPSSTWDDDSLQVLPVRTSLVLGGGSFVVTVQSTGPGGAIVQLGSPITAKYDALGGVGGSLGAATTSIVCGLRSAGCYQGFSGGAIYWSPATGAHLVAAPVAARWAASGWEAGAMGFPVTDTVCGLSDSGCFQHFESASVFSSSAGGTHAVWGAIRGWWWAHGSETGTAGYPTTEEICGLRSGGCYQGFTKGTVYWSPGTGAHLVAAPVAARWAAQGWETGPMGYPVSDTTCGLSDGGCYQHFDVGSIYSSASTGVHAVWGAILQRWGGQGWETGPAGYPTSEESCDASGCQQQFRGAVISWSPTAGTRISSR